MTVGAVPDNAAKFDELSGAHHRTGDHAARHLGMAAMFLVAPPITPIDTRLLVLFGFVLTSVAMWQMSQFSLQMGMAPIISSGLLQGFRFGCTQVPLNTIAL
jgi:MFS transporter, DHA2 family, multidrug resistance protein